MRVHLAVAYVVGLLLSGCDHLPKPGLSGTRSMIVDPTNTWGQLFVWSNQVNAGMVTKSGDVCMQRAMTARAFSASGDTKVPIALADLSAAAKAASDAGKTADVAQLSGAIAQTAGALSTSTERTAFLDIGMFYLCQLGANGDLTQPQVVELTKQLIVSAAAITPTGTPVVIDAPTLPKPDGEAQDASNFPTAAQGAGAKN